MCAFRSIARPGSRDLGLILEGKSVLNINAFDDFHKNIKNDLPRDGKKARVFDVFGLKNAISS